MYNQLKKNIAHQAMTMDQFNLSAACLVFRKTFSSGSLGNATVLVCIIVCMRYDFTTKFCNNSSTLKFQVCMRSTQVKCNYFSSEHNRRSIEPVIILRNFSKDFSICFSRKLYLRHSLRENKSERLKSIAFQ